MLTRRSLLRTGLSCALACLAAGANTIRAQTGERLRIQRLGWAGVRLQLGQADLYIDPLEDPAAWGSDLREALVPIETTGGQRFVLVTHRHPDHCDPVAIKKLVGAHGALVTATSPCTIDPAPRILSGALYEPQLLGDFTATAVPAVDGYGDPQVSWIVKAGGRSIIHCGDTLWHGSWWRVGRQHGPFDVAFLPINGARFGWMQPVSEVPAVLTPEQAVAAAVILGAKRLVPIHYGVAPSPEYTEVPDAPARTVAEGKRRGIAVKLLKPGEWLDLDGV